MPFDTSLRALDTLYEGVQSVEFLPVAREKLYDGVLSVEFLSAAREKLYEGVQSVEFQPALLGRSCMMARSQ